MVKDSLLLNFKDTSSKTAKFAFMDDQMAFFQFLHKFVDLSPEEYKTYIQPHVVIRKFDKKGMVTQAGEVENYFNFIISGLARKFYKKGSDEIIVQIAVEGHLILAQESFHSRMPSEYSIETIEPSVMASVTFDDLEKIYSTNVKMERLGRLITTFMMILRDKWNMQSVKLTPRERFLYFINNNYNLMQRVPQKYLASYLNIQPETFSRFKHLLRERKVEKR
jgi:CRP-like cAMP-binding protein